MRGPDRLRLHERAAQIVTRLTITSLFGSSSSASPRSRSRRASRVAAVSPIPPHAEQLRLLRVAAAAIARLGDLLNKVVWVAADGSMRVEDMPPP